MTVAGRVLHALHLDHHDPKPAKLDPEVAKLVSKLGKNDLESLVLKKLRDQKPLTGADVKAAAGLGTAEPVEKHDPKKNAKKMVERMSTAKVLALDNDFAVFDTNGDGDITLDEFIKIMKRPVNGKVPDWEEAQLVPCSEETISLP